MQPLNIFLVFVPAGIASGLLDWGALPTFLLNFIAIVPLAKFLGDCTEELAAHTGQIVGGLLNATFGNAVEMIVTISAIRAGLVSIVQGSLIGSILSNLLLVLGMSFIAGEAKTHESTFSSCAASCNITCLVLASLALTLPTVYTYVPDSDLETAVSLSRIIALLMAFTYCLFLFFQLKTHNDLFEAEADDDADAPPVMAAGVAGVLLFGSTCVVAYCSEFLVNSIQGVSKDWHLPQQFIGIILLPIVGNAAEHVSAVSAAAKGKMDLALGVAVGSATQIALFVIPFSVMVGWAINVPMTLDFHVFNAVVFVLSVFVASSVLADGRGNWFEGAMLCTTYCIIAVVCWYLPDSDVDRPVARALLSSWMAPEDSQLLAAELTAVAVGDGGVLGIFV